ncbi:MAG: FMN-binding negative transcriptional regulator [Erythrobacter sp.]|jgi:transcriptional regulator|nr:FMN-binding negative transcriptional regulator [Erythrobacter sp.]
MHPACAFRHEDVAFRHAMVEDIGFAMVFMTTPDGPRVAHTPAMLSDSGIIRFHLARSNALTQYLDGANALAVVNGPDAYVSARWYAADNQVPTWNYIAFEFEGLVTRLPDHELAPLVEMLSNHHEARVSHGKPWTIDKMDEAAFAALLRGIVGFEMRVETVRETVKMSQNKSAEERARIAEGLRNEGHDEVAGFVQRIA